MPILYSSMTIRSISVLCYCMCGHLHTGGRICLWELGWNQLGKYVLCCNTLWGASVLFTYISFLGLSLVPIFRIQPLPSTVPISWVQCSWHCGLWSSTLTAVHCYTSSLHYQVNSILVNCYPLYCLMDLNNSARFSKVLSNRNSVEGIWLLSIITYKYTADTCFNLLRCQKVSSGESTNEFVSHLQKSKLVTNCLLCWCV